MNLLKQTALILGLMSLTLGAWTLFRDWKNKISILFALVCFGVAVWALSFVAHATLVGRLSYDIHLFANVMLVPLSLELLSRLFLKEKDGISRILFWGASGGAAVLGVMIAFSLGGSPGFRSFVLFWPTFILVEYLHILAFEFFSPERTRVDTVSPAKRTLLYLGLGITLSICTFDHVPVLGYGVPALGNLLFTLYLLFANQIIVPEKILGIEALASRFFAVLTLSLIITGFFALLFNYVSSSFPLFLLNSFLISFAVLALWPPLLVFFRFLARGLLSSAIANRERRFEVFKGRASAAWEITELTRISNEYFKAEARMEGLEFIVDADESHLPPAVLRYWNLLITHQLKPILYSGIIEREREQALSRERRLELDELLGFLDAQGAEAIFPVFSSGKVIGLIRMRGRGRLAAFPRFSEAVELLEFLAGNLVRIRQIERARERDRLLLLGEMSAGLAHEIRNPLGAIRGAVALMDPGSDPWAKVIREEVDRLNRLVSRFLDFATDSGERREPVDLNAVLQTGVAHLRPGLDSRVEIEWIPSPVPVPVILDPDSVQQVLSNLVQNSLKAFEEGGGGKIAIETFQTGFKVRDNGCGMSGEVLSRVFQPFFTTFKEGSGLGLSICQRLVGRDEGRIQVRSEAGVGTEVIVEYPDA